MLPTHIPPDVQCQLHEATIFVFFSLLFLVFVFWNMRNFIFSHFRLSVRVRVRVGACDKNHVCKQTSQPIMAHLRTHRRKLKSQRAAAI